MAAGKSVSFKLTGVERMLAALARIEAQMIDDVLIALREEAEDVMRRSITEFIPIDESTLKDSGFVNDVVRRGNDLSVTMGFGQDASAHALATHETPSQYDPRSWKGKTVKFKRGGRKYLERPLMEATQGMGGRIANKVRPK